LNSSRLQQIGFVKPWPCARDDRSRSFDHFERYNRSTGRDLDHRTAPLSISLWLKDPAVRGLR
jgi:hypothetical protein